MFETLLGNLFMAFRLQKCSKIRLLLQKVFKNSIVEPLLGHLFMAFALQKVRKKSIFQKVPNKSIVEPLLGHLFYGV